jgi:hypothetical protein
MSRVGFSLGILFNLELNNVYTALADARLARVAD